MLGLYVTVPVACFRKGLAREFLETEPLPPPATCYGFLLALVGENDRHRHVGCRVAPILLNSPPISVVLRTVWRVKKLPLGSSGNTRPDYQQLLTSVELAIWLDSTDEVARGASLEERVNRAVTQPRAITRCGGLSLGESTHLVDEVSILPGTKHDREGQAFLTSPRGRLTLPVWVDHVGSAGTRYVTGDLVKHQLLLPPDRHRMPRISPERQSHDAPR